MPLPKLFFLKGIFLLFICSGGCSSNERPGLVGTVTVDGQPLQRYEVALVAERGGIVAGAFTRADGKYEITNLLPGVYKVVIRPYAGPVLPGMTPPPQEPVRVPLAVTLPEQTTLSVEVNKDRPTTKDFNLTSVPNIS